MEEVSLNFYFCFFFFGRVASRVTGRDGSGGGIQLGGCSPSDVSTDPVENGRAATAAGRARRGGWVGYDERRLRWTEISVQAPEGVGWQSPG